MRYLMILLMLLLPGLCYSDVYVEKDAQGNTIFTDAPNDENAEKLTIGTSSTVDSKKNTTPSAHPTPVKQASDEQTVEHKPYLTFMIVSPSDQASIQNQPTLSVTVSTDPKLQAGDKIAVFLDGQPWGMPGTSTTLSLNAPNKGAHQLSAKILDQDGKVLATTATITIYVHQGHVGSPPRAL